jgi:amino acid adenylation domain-containing protein/non-ribosomal peptide synthase protein (TIGR01720 family)
VCSFKVQVRIDQREFGSALQRVVEKNEILRTRLIQLPGSGSPVQVITAEPVYSLELRSLELASQTEKDAELRGLFASECARDEKDETGLRAVCILVPGDETLVVLSVPGYAADYAGLANLAGEVLDNYETAERGDSGLNAGPQYADIAQTLNEYLELPEFYEGQKYWVNRMEPDLAPAWIRQVDLLSGGRFCSVALEFDLPPEIVGQVDHQCELYGVSRADFFLSCWQIVACRRVDASPSVMVGMAFNGRNHPMLEPLLGLFERYLPLTQYLEPASPFNELLLINRAGIAEMSKWQQYFSWKIARNSLDQLSSHYSAWSFEYRPLDVLYLPRHRMVLQDAFYVSEGFELKAAFIESEAVAENRIKCRLHYNSTTIKAREAQALATQLAAVIRSCAANPLQVLSDVSLIDASTRQDMLHRWNETKHETPRACIHELFESEVSLHPRAIAVEYQNITLTFAGLNERANQLAHYLRFLGIGPETRVALCVERGIELMVGILGVLKAGGVYVPLDPDYPMERLSFMLSDAGCPVLLTQESLKSRLPTSWAQVICLDSNWSQIAENSDANPTAITDPDGLAYVIYTSGSTGSPKGVCISHASAVNFAKANGQAFGVNSSTVFLQFASPSFDASISEWLTSLLNGGKLVLVDREATLPGPQFIELMERNAINLAILPPSVLAAIPPNSLPCLRTLIVAGEACAPNLVRQWANNRTMKNAYGPTETTVGATISEALTVDSDAPIGKPMWNVRVYVLNSEMEICPVDMPGELYIGGAGVARGYLNRPDLTAMKFVPDPFSSEPGKRLYRTGDLASWRIDGNLEFQGRIDHQIKIRGYRIEPEEIESALMENPRVLEAVVAVYNPAPNNQRLTAFLVARTNEALDDAEIRKHLQARLPQFMLPTLYFQVERLPLTPNGKVDRRELAKDPQKYAGHYRQKSEYEPPRTPAEEKLCAIWAGVLRVDKVGRNDNFFELGGDSILGIQVVSRSHEAGLQFTVRQIFDTQTVAELAEAAETVQYAKVDEALVTGSAQLTPIQASLLEKELTNPHHYNQSMLLELMPRTDSSLLKQSLEQVMHRHEVLNSRFVRKDNRWWQVYGGVERLSYERLDLSEAGMQARAQLEREAARIQASLNLSEGPLVRAVEFALGGDNGRRLLLVIHHMVIDAVSWGILFEDIERIYAGIAQGKPVTLPCKTSSFKHWAERLEQYSQEHELIAEAEYWIGQDWKLVKPVPVDHRLGENTVASRAALSVCLTTQQTAILLQELPRIAHMQIHEALIIALASALSGYVDSETVLISLEGHGRENVFSDVNLSRTIGWFTTEFPVLLSVSRDAMTSAKQLRRIKAQLRQVPNRGLGYGALKYLRAPNDPELNEKMRSFVPANVSFNYLGRMDTAVTSSELFSRASESPGPSQPSGALRRHMMEIEAYILESAVHVRWSYSTNLHTEKTITCLLNKFLSELQLLVDHCQSSKAEVYSPSDFALAGLKESELKRITRRLKSQ